MGVSIYDEATVIAVQFLTKNMCVGVYIYIPNRPVIDPLIFICNRYICRLKPQQVWSIINIPFSPFLLSFLSVVLSFNPKEGFNLSL